MGSKGNKQTTQTAQTQSYSADPRIQQSGELAMNQAIGAAQSPFQMPVAPVAGFNPFQQQAFGQVQGAQGMTDPYFAQARNYIDQSASPLTGGTVNQYYNPMADSVTAQLQNIFGQQNRQATGSATQAAGGVGADRIGVAQGNLANQQTLGAGQVYANLYQQAVQNAQADKARQQAAGYAYGQLGPAAQAANLQATSALGGAGNQQQQLAQQQANAPYQNILAQIAYPFQTSQFLAGITGGLAPAFGGTTSGYGTSQTQLPTPSPLNQILGVGTAALGAYMGMPGGGTGKGGSQTGSTYGATNNGSGFGYGSYGGTQVPTYFAEGGEVGGDESSPPPFPYLSLPKTGASPIPTVHLPMGGGQFHNNLNLNPPQQSGKSDSGSSGIGAVANLASKVLPFILAARGGAVNPYAIGEGFADGGDTDFNDRFSPVYEMNSSEDSGNPFDASYVYSVPGAPIEAPGTPMPHARPLGAPDVPRNVLDRAGTAVKTIETNPQGDYQNITTTTNPRTGQRQNALGAYQVMENELPEWTSKVFGEPISKQEFLYGPNSKQIQDTLFRQRFGESAQRYGQGDPRRGVELAGREWFGGPGGVTNTGRTDAFGRLTTGGYGRQVVAEANPQEGEDITGAPADGETNISARERQFNPYAPANTDMNIGRYHLPKGDQPYPDALNRDWGQNAARSPWMSLIHAGAAIASTTGPVGTAIAKGFGAGAGALENQRKELRTEQDQNLKADHLFQQAQMHLDEYTRMKPGQAGLLAEQHRYHDILDEQRREFERGRQQDRQDRLQEQMRQHNLQIRTPIKIGETVSGAPIMAMPKANAQGGIDLYRMDPKTGELSDTPIGQKNPLKSPQSGNKPGLQTEGFTPVADPLAQAIQSAPPPEIRAAAPDASPQARNEEYLRKIAEDDPRYAADIKKIANYEMSPQQFSLRNNRREKAMGDVALYDPTYDQRRYNQTNRAITGWSQSPEGRATRSFGVVVEHLGTAEELGKALQNGDVQAINQLKNAIKTQFGYEGPVNFNAAKQIVGDEIAKAVIGGVNAERDREGLHKSLSAANSPEQLNGVIQTMKKLMAGQLIGYRHQYETSTGLHNFDDWMTPRARLEMSKVQAERGAEMAGQTIPKTGLQPQDQQAMDWANANPNDPRAAAIKKRLGIQ